MTKKTKSKAPKVKPSKVAPVENTKVLPKEAESIKPVMKPLGRPAKRLPKIKKSPPPYKPQGKL
jgi:DNA-directed RNA polymerase subunit H (RpoH/RPB5)